MKPKKKWLSSMLEKNFPLIKCLSEYRKFFSEIVLKKTFKKARSKLVQLAKKSWTLAIKIASSENKNTTA